MHSLIHPHLARASSRATTRNGRNRRPRRDHPPPRRLRGAAAHVLAAVAARLDADRARRAVV
jgi:hypothetical protein